MTFYTIKTTAKMGPIPESRLRAMLKQGRLPGYFSGNRYYVHYEMLMEMLNETCRANMAGSAVNE